MGEDLVDRLALPDDERGVNALTVAHPFREDVEMRLDPFAGLRAHDLAHADPVVEFIGRDHRQDLHTALGIGRAHGCKAHRVQAFARVVENHEKFPHGLLPFRGRSLREGRGVTQSSRWTVRQTLPAQSTAASIRSCPQNSSSPTSKVGAPKMPLFRAASV
jgi:hypothetical protein